MVAHDDDEEDVAREEDEVVDKIHEEVGSTLVQDELLEACVGGGKAAVRLGQDGCSVPILCLFWTLFQI